MLWLIDHNTNFHLFYYRIRIHSSFLFAELEPVQGGILHITKTHFIIVPTNLQTYVLDLDMYLGEGLSIGQNQDIGFPFMHRFMLGWFWE